MYTGIGFVVVEEFMKPRQEKESRHKKEYGCPSVGFPCFGFMLFHFFLILFIAMLYNHSSSIFAGLIVGGYIIRIKIRCQVFFNFLAILILTTDEHGKNSD